MTTDQTPGRIEPERFAEAPPVLSPDEAVPADSATNWPVLVIPADPGVTNAATPGSQVAAAALEHETAFLERKKRQLDLAPHLTPDVPEARVAGIVSWSDLTDEVLLTILANTGLMKGLRVDPERLVLEPAARAALTVEAETLRGSVNLCREDYFTHRACDDQVETALATSSVVKGSASASYAFASAKVAASQREQATRQEGRRSVTAVGRQLSRRAVVFLSRDRVRPTPEFLAAVTAALARPDVIAQAQALSEVFEVFGLIWAQEVGLGSARTVATDVQVSDVATSREVERHISAAVNVKFGGASGRATAEAGQVAGTDTHVRDEVAEASSTTQGDVESPLHWAVIARDRLTPVYELLPQDLRDRVLEVLFRARPELVEPVFARPMVLPENRRASSGAATPQTAPPAHRAPAYFSPAELRTHTPVAADALLLVSCEGAAPDAGWSQVDVEGTGGPLGPVATTRLVKGDAYVDFTDDQGPSKTLAVTSLLELPGFRGAWRPAGTAKPAAATPDASDVVASHSVLMPVRWPDSYVLRQRRGAATAGSSITTLPIEVITFTGGDRSSFEAWTEWLPWDGERDLAAVCPPGATVTEPPREAAQTATARISWRPDRSGLLVVTAGDPIADRRHPRDNAAVALTVTQGPLIASLDADPCLPTPLSLTVPVVKSDLLVLGLAITHYRWDADAQPLRRASIPLRFWFLPIRDAMAHMGSPEPIVVNDLYTARADGFVTIHDPTEAYGTVGVMVPEVPLEGVAAGDPTAEARIERPRALATRIRGATVTVPVRQGESFRAVVTNAVNRRVEEPNRLPDLRDAFVDGAGHAGQQAQAGAVQDQVEEVVVGRLPPALDRPGEPRAVFVPLRRVIPS